MVSLHSQSLKKLMSDFLRDGGEGMANCLKER